MCQYRWSVKGYKPSRDVKKSSVYKDWIIDSYKNPVQLIEQIHEEEGRDFVIEHLELTHRIELQ